MNQSRPPFTDSFRRIALDVRSIIGQYPSLYFSLLRLKSKPNGVPVDRDTELVVEGFPRSANTFALVAITLFQDRPLRTAHHLHVPAQVLRALQQSIPSLVLIRPPEDAVLSQIIRNPFLTLPQELRAYTRFYRTLLPHKKEFVTAEFSEVVTDFSKIVERLDRRYDLGLRPFEHTEENLARCYEEINRLDQLDTGRPDVTWATVARPSRRRDEVKRTIQSQLEHYSAQPGLRAAQAVYRDFITD